MRAALSSVVTALLLTCVSAELGGTGKIQVYKGSPNCQIPSMGSASRKHIIEGLEYLGGKAGDSVTIPAKGPCSRVSCSYNSAINVCNDDNKPVTLGFDSIAGLAFDITNQCNQGGRSKFNGQEFNQSTFAGGWNWNVRIEAADC